MSSYTTLADHQRHHAETEIKRSRFLAYAQRVNTEHDARAVVADLRREHHTARHHCSAFILGPRGDIQRSSDDGEPAGTAGAPMMEVLREFATPGMSDIVTVVVRYFGGVKLGAGGLVRAYAGAVADLLTRSPLVVRREVPGHTVTLPLTEAARLESAVRHACHVVDVEYSYPDATFTLASDLAPDELSSQLSTLAGSSLQCSPADPVWAEVPYS